MRWDELSVRKAAQRAALHIAVDGPAGAGKSTIGRNLAAALACPYLDTGLMYRAVTLAALRRDLPLWNGPLLQELARIIHFSLGPGDLELRIQGHLPEEELRSPRVDAAVSEVSAHPEVRQVMVERQRALAAGRCAVVVGRDIGTVVLPDAPVKLWITASPEERARRRALEHPGAPETEETAFEALRLRDAYDSGRAASPLRMPPDATIIETDRLTPDEALHRALDVIAVTLEREHLAPPPRTAH